MGLSKKILKTMSELEKALYQSTKCLYKEVGDLTKDKIKVRAMTIVNRRNPEWGTFGVYEYTNFEGSEWWDIGRGGGERVLFESEFHEWAIVQLGR